MLTTIRLSCPKIFFFLDALRLVAPGTWQHRIHLNRATVSCIALSLIVIHYHKRSHLEEKAVAKWIQDNKIIKDSELVNFYYY